MIKENVCKPGRTPCAYCSMPAETKLDDGTQVCLTHYMYPFRRKKAAAVVDEQVKELIK